jgi:hypothetical protein
MKKPCPVVKDGYCCTLLLNHQSLHYDAHEKRWFSETWPHATGWHWPANDLTGHAGKECLERGCYGMITGLSYDQGGRREI